MLTTSQQGMLDLAHSFFQQQASGLAPCAKDEPLPWQDASLDAFSLSTGALQPGVLPLDFQALMEDRSRFDRHIRHLANGKAAGPDEVPNEVLKYLSEDLLECLHLWIVLTFRSGRTPACMKQSTTVLLHKKGDPAELNNYRPICLSNTLGKLYTGMLADCMQDFSDHHGILTAGQEGFRRGRGTSRQLQLVVNTLADAKMTQQAVFALYVDFSSAFNTRSFAGCMLAAGAMH